MCINDTHINIEYYRCYDYVSDNSERSVSPPIVTCGYCADL